jgi:predicted transcriptional regulator of viral defense system
MGFLLQQSKLQELQLTSEDMGDATRYAWGTPSPFALALSLRKHAYLCHGSAVFLHGLTQDLPKTFYINVEQSPKPGGSGSMTQESIDLAFSRPPRMSRYILRWNRLSFVVVSGKSTGRLEVGRIQSPEGELLEATKLERTLIDIAVRPAYAGGVFKVLEAYTTAQDRISVNTLVATLKKLGYVYPYHQAIGFLMERAGYAAERLEPLRKLEMRFDFYLSHGIKEKAYDSRWKLFFPKGM